jgi:hypothetical protein
VIAWRCQSHVAWLLPALVMMAMVIFAAQMANGVDASWLARALDAKHRNLEDSSALLFADASVLPPLAQLQRARIEARFMAMSSPDLRPTWPQRRIAGSALLALAGLLGALSFSTLSQHKVASAAPATIAAGLEAPTRLISQQLDVQPPSYTGLPARREYSLQAKVPEGSTLRWTLRISPQPSQVELLFHDGTRLAMQRRGDQWTASRQLGKSTLYRLSLTGVPPMPGAALQRIDVIADQAPQIRVIAPDRSLTVLDRQQQKWPLLFEASDDFGLGAAQLRITLAQGSGENISVSARTLQLSGTGNARRRSYHQLLDLSALGFAIGDDLVVRLAVSDRRTPVANTTRSASFILRWPPAAGEEASGVEGLVKRTLPAFFRSQRQIIIDSEALLKKRSALAQDAFVKQSDEIGVDQHILRLRYGQFLGEESEGGHEDTGAGGKPVAFGDAASLVETYGHTHDLPEAATLLDPGTRALLKSALDEMWQAELHLRQGRPDQALPYEYRALRFIKQVQQASRIYLARVGLELPPIDESRRLGGDRAGLQNRRDALAPAQLEASPVLQLWQALDRGRVGPNAVELDDFERWLRAREAVLPEALDLFAALDEVRRAPECADCASELRARIWPLLAAPPPAVPGRQDADPTGRAYLDALQSQAPP